RSIRHHYYDQEAGYNDDEGEYSDEEAEYYDDEGEYSDDEGEYSDEEVDGGLPAGRYQAQTARAVSGHDR
ncbi:MAG: hypothetical protein AAGH65_08595, partial [Pseudomonadota bacterium]